jgi:DNA-binding MarR family transcriptional regulator
MPATLRARLDIPRDLTHYFYMSNIDTINHMTTRPLLDSLTRLRACCETIELGVRTEAELTEAQSTLLAGMPETGEITTGELCTKVGYSPSRGGRVIEELVTRGLIHRRQDAGDRRVSQVSLSPGGRHLQDRLTTLLQACERDVLSELDPAQLDTVQTGLALLDAALSRVLARKHAPTNDALQGAAPPPP